MNVPTTSFASQTSVIVVAYDAGDDLRACVASLHATQPEAEVVIVDNGSTDGAAARVRAEFPTVRLVRSERNVGFAGGSNRGAAAATGAYLLFLNPDAVVTPGWLEALIRPLAEEKTIGLVTPKVLLRADPSRINVAGLDVHLSGISMCRGLDAPADAFPDAQEVAAISGVAVAVRRSVFEAIGGFDPDFFLYMEDVDLSLRAWLSGYRCLYVPHPVVRHDYALEIGPRKTFYVERGRYLMLLKAFRWRTLLSLLPSLLLAEGMTWGWILGRRPRAIPHKLRAYGWILSHRSQIAAQRRRVQARRLAPDAAFLSHCRWNLSLDQLVNPRVARAAEALLRPFLRGSSRVARFALGR